MHDPGEGLRFWQVMEGKTAHYFLLKQQAKAIRDDLLGKGQDEAHVSKGPDHDKHFTRREPCGVNKGKHPKKGHKGKSQATSFWKK